MPLPLVVTLRVLPPMDKSRVLPASALPLTTAVCSALLTTLSTATALMDGARGAVVSTATA